MEYIKEGTDLTVTLNFADANKNPVIPTSFIYTVVDQFETVIIEDTTVNPGTAAYTLVIPGNKNLLVEGLAEDIRYISVVFYYLVAGITRQGTDFYVYKVSNIKGLTAVLV